MIKIRTILGVSFLGLISISNIAVAQVSEATNTNSHTFRTEERDNRAKQDIDRSKQAESGSKKSTDNESHGYNGGYKYERTPIQGNGGELRR